MSHNDPCDNYDGAFDQWEPPKVPKLTDHELRTLRTIHLGRDPYGGGKNPRVVSQTIMRLRRKGALVVGSNTTTERVSSAGLKALERSR